MDMVRKDVTDTLKDTELASTVEWVLLRASLILAFTLIKFKVLISPLS